MSGLLTHVGAPASVRMRSTRPSAERWLLIMSPSTLGADVLSSLDSLSYWLKLSHGKHL